MLQREILQYAKISVFGRIRCISPKNGRILRGGSKVPHIWDQRDKKNFFHTKLSATSWNYILLIFCMWIEGEMIIIHAEFWSFAS